MHHTKQFALRSRLNMSMPLNEDFRKKIWTREYGNYDKYTKNRIKIVADNSEQDKGQDTLFQNQLDVDQRMHSMTNEDYIKEKKKNFEDVIFNRDIMDEDIGKHMQKTHDYRQDQESVLEGKNYQEALNEGFDDEEVTYEGRLSPWAREEIYRLYLSGMTVKDLSLKYGILPQRVKAVVFMRFTYWNEVYPKMGLTHQRLALMREMEYAEDFPFVDYGIDLDDMKDMQRGIHTARLRDINSDVALISKEEKEQAT